MSLIGGPILGIETSCDETAAAVVEGGRRVRSSVVASQHELHAEYRGVVPEIASRAHAERLTPVVVAALRGAGVDLDEIGAVAVGHRPGLIGSLLVGVSAAKALAWSLGVPLVGVDHVHAHLHAGSLDREAAPMPALGLVVSGGHTALYWCESPTRAVRLGATIDDAAGEAYDKVASILGLGFPGGPSVDRLAQRGDERALDLPVSRLGPDSLDFSFSGLKTAVLYAFRGVPASPTRARGRGSGDSAARGEGGSAARGEGGSAEGGGAGAPAAPRAEDVAASFQRAVALTLALKVRRALDRHPQARCLIVGGGVSANTRVRSAMAEVAAERGVELRLPAGAYCVDNAAMIAGLGWEVLQERGGAGDAWSLAAVPTTAL